MGGRSSSQETEPLHRNSNQQPMCTSSTVLVQKLKGLLAEFVSNLFFVASAVAVQLLKGSIPHFELKGTRFACSVFLLTLGLLLKKKSPAILTSHIVITVGLGITILADTTSLYIAVIYIPVSAAQSILISTEIISGIFLFAIFVKEKITIKGIVFAALCVIGVFLVIQPDFIFHRKNQLQKTNDLQNLTAADQQLTDNGFTYHTDVIGYAWCILSGLSFQ